jgi:DNA-binding response OmpR family regulator
LHKVGPEAHLTSTVLIVDTNKSVVGAIAEELAHAGYDPSGANSYGDAGRRLQAESPDVVVVSVELGAYNGLQLAMRCAQSHPATRVIVVGPASAALEHDACELGASAYMARPLTAGAVADRLKTLEPVGRSRHSSSMAGFHATA